MWACSIARQSAFDPTISTIRRTQSRMSVSIWCSQIRMTVQPERRRLLKFLWSRTRFFAILSCQNGGSRCAQTGNRHPCQKSPSTKTATLLSLNTKSGFPGSDASWRAKTNPAASSNAFRYFSGDVFFAWLRDITRLRCSTDITSATGSLPSLHSVSSPDLGEKSSLLSMTGHDTFGFFYSVSVRY